jgi:hypothetical protein
MRTLPFISDTWQSGGPFIGPTRPVTRVTVQEPWPDLAGDPDHEHDILRTSTNAGTSNRRGVPIRWYQDMANSHAKREVPNLRSVSIDRSIDQDAATIEIELTNQWMYAPGAGPAVSVAVGQPGYFTPNRGESMEARARWGHEANEWRDVLVPNALLRVYTGFGGDEASYPNVLSAVSAGKLALYGCFLLDEVVISTDGTVHMRGRDMAKLLIDQQLFPPLVPAKKYPLEYSRWTFKNRHLKIGARAVPDGATTTITLPGPRITEYATSSGDMWYGANAIIEGHSPREAADGAPYTYALSPGHRTPYEPWVTDYWEFKISGNQNVNAVLVRPWGGNYDMYVSVKESGVWQGTETVPYDYEAHAAAQDPVVNTYADIPYVQKFSVPWEEPRLYILPRKYFADRIRISLRRHTYSGESEMKYRAGLREVEAWGVKDLSAYTFGSLTEGDVTVYEPMVMAAGVRSVPGKPYSFGYTTVSNFDQTDYFGDARNEWATGVNGDRELWGPRSVRYTKTGEGYYVLSAKGHIRCHGDAQDYGDPIRTYGFSSGAWPLGYAWDMAVTHTGNGYWVLNGNGTVWAFGDATNFNAPITTTELKTATSIEAHPTAMGYWVLRNDGTVFNAGAATNYGSYPKITVFNGVNFAEMSERATCLRCTSDGTGYWILTSVGHGGNYGSAKSYGFPIPQPHSENFFTQAHWQILVSPDDSGYLILRADGTLTAHGDAKHFGSPVPGGEAQLRYDGNYLDYVDIIEDLVRWSGFYFYDPNQPGDQEAAVYGSLESTGAWADEKLPDDTFDKRPVIDAITTIREVVGYLSFVDSEGRFRFESPNWWHIGNFNEDGQHIEFLPELDERVTLTQYTMSTSDAPLRSSVIISSHDPYANYSTTLTHSHKPPNAYKLRGIVKPAMWVNQFFINPKEQKLMAELISLHIGFQERVGQVTCIATPHIEINDQVRIYERQTGEVYVHYVRGISFTHDLDSGDYMMTLTTHWLAAGQDSGDVVGSEYFTVSPLLQQEIEAQRYGKLQRDPGASL